MSTSGYEMSKAWNVRADIGRSSVLQWHWTMCSKHIDRLRSNCYSSCWEDVYDQLRYACLCDRLMCVGLMGSLFLMGAYIWVAYDMVIGIMCVMVGIDYMPVNTLTIPNLFNCYPDWEGLHDHWRCVGLIWSLFLIKHMYFSGIWWCFAMNGYSKRCF